MELLPPKVLASRLGITRRTPRRWVSQGVLPPPIRATRKTVFWKWEDVVRWLEHSRHSARKKQSVTFGKDNAT